MTLAGWPWNVMVELPIPVDPLVSEMPALVASVSKPPVAVSVTWSLELERSVIAMAFRPPEEKTSGAFSPVAWALGVEMVGGTLLPADTLTATLLVVDSPPASVIVATKL